MSSYPKIRELEQRPSKEDYEASKKKKEAELKELNELITQQKATIDGAIVYKKMFDKY
jgi:hypothetical protein